MVQVTSFREFCWLRGWWLLARSIRRSWFSGRTSGFLTDILSNPESHICVCRTILIFIIKPWSCCTFLNTFSIRAKEGKLMWTFDSNLFERHANSCRMGPFSKACIGKADEISLRQISLCLVANLFEYTCFQFPFAWVLQISRLPVRFYIHKSREVLRCYNNFSRQEVIPSLPLREKCPNTEFFLVRIFPHSHWIRIDTNYLSVFSPNAWKHGPEKSLYLDTFHTVFLLIDTI